MTGIVVDVSVGITIVGVDGVTDVTVVSVAIEGISPKLQPDITKPKIAKKKTKPCCIKKFSFKPISKHKNTKPYNAAIHRIAGKTQPTSIVNEFLKRANLANEPRLAIRVQ